MKDLTEIIVYGRGGQGGKTAGILIAKAALIDKKEMQAFPEYGPEKTGAPVKVFVKLSKNPIKAFTPVLKPDIALFLDPTLLKAIDLKEEIAKDTKIIINTNKSKQQIKKEYKLNSTIYTLDGTKLALEITGKSLPNMAMLGAIAKISKLVSINSLVKASKEYLIKKLGAENTQKNIILLKKAYNQAK